MAGSFEDRFGIQELVSRYNHAIDFADYATWSAITESLAG